MGAVHLVRHGFCGTKDTSTLAPSSRSTSPLFTLAAEPGPSRKEGLGAEVVALGPGASEAEHIGLAGPKFDLHRREPVFGELDIDHRDRRLGQRAACGPAAS